MDPHHLLQSVEDAKRHMPMAVERLQVLQQLIKVLSSFEDKDGPSRIEQVSGKRSNIEEKSESWSNTYESLRGKFLTSSLLLLKTETKLEDNVSARGEGSVPLVALAGGQQLSHPVVELFWALYLMTAVRISPP